MVATALAGGYGSNYGSNYGSGYSGYSGLRTLGLGAPLSNYGGGYSGGQNVLAAVQSRRSLGFIDVPTTYSAPTPLTVDVPANVQPLNFLMRSQSSPLNLDTVHQSSPGSYQETSSVDEPHVRVHNVQRPILQQVNEIISPYRQIRQQVQPVQENIEQVVARGYQQQPAQLAYAQQPLQLVQQVPLKTGYSGSYAKSGY